MSHIAEIVDICRDLSEYGLTKDQCARVFVDITEALEWDLFDFDYSDQNWPHIQQGLGEAYLYPEVEEDEDI